MDRIVIGDKSKLYKNQCISTFHMDIPTLTQTHISENEEIYSVYCSFDYISSGIIIFKETITGLRIKAMLSDPELKEKDFSKFIDLIALESLSSEEIYDMIEWTKKDAFENGEQKAKRKIRDVLGI